ncbi:fucose permease [Rubidibacter lacunae KORDI 51-2]|uniref:Fucose permease n=1 Tax=Rubidibacter lacunae KORDI 51-2 TaxID=582515 RepID=U5DME6_9CHRO|nr:MFS transporter [Rubidibacter lacunae]ERN40880.1 fucose permease [Rubidibacter lacunae KORDI 51-2]
MSVSLLNDPDQLSATGIAGRAPSHDPTDDDSKATGLQIAIAALAFALVGVGDGTVGILLPELSASYGVVRTTVGMLLLSNAIGYLLTAAAGGWLASRLGRPRYLLLGTASFLSASTMMALQPPLWGLLTLPLLVGSGTAVLETGLTAFAARRSSNPALLNYLHALFGIGAFVGPLAASALLHAGFNWSSIYWMQAGGALLLLVSFGATYRHWRLELAAVSLAVGNPVAAALRLRLVWCMSLFFLFYVGAEISLGHWSFSYLSEERHIRAALAGGLTSGYWLGLALGRLSLAQLAALVDARRLIHGCLLGVVLGVVLYWSGLSRLTTGLGLVLTGFSLGPILPTAISLMAERLPARLVLSAVSLCASFGSLGKAIFPWLAGNVTALWGLTAFLPYVSGLVLLTVGCWLAIAILSRARLPEWCDAEVSSSSGA